MIDVEGMTERELSTLESYYSELGKLARKEAEVSRSHSVEEARSRHALKKPR